MQRNTDSPILVKRPISVGIVPDSVFPQIEKKPRSHRQVEWNKQERVSFHVVGALKEANEMAAIICRFRLTEILTEKANLSRNGSFEIIIGKRDISCVTGRSNKSADEKTGIIVRQTESSTYQLASSDRFRLEVDPKAYCDIGTANLNKSTRKR